MFSQNAADFGVSEQLCTSLIGRDDIVGVRLVANDFLNNIDSLVHSSRGCEGKGLWAQGIHFFIDRF